MAVVTATAATAAVRRGWRITVFVSLFQYLLGGGGWGVLDDC